MFVNNASTFKVYQELKQYMYVKDCLNDIDLSYYYLQTRKPYFLDNNGYIYPRLEYNTSGIHRYFFGKDDKLAYTITDNTTVDYLLQMVDNYINNRDISYNLANQSNMNSDKLCDSITKKVITFSDFEKSLNKIPEADLYLISIHTEPLSILQYILAIYLLKKYKNCHILIGGGRNANIDNPETILINKIGESYFDNRLHRCAGAIGPTVFNFINNKDYDSCFIDIKEYFEKPWNISLTNYEVNTVCDNEMYLSTSYGCPNRCAYCSGCCSHPHTYLDNLEYYGDILRYLSSTYPQCKLVLFDNELNDDLERFKKSLYWLTNNEIKNPFMFFINLYPLDDETLSLLYKVNIGRLTTSFDGMFERLPYRKYNIDTDPKMTMFNRVRQLAWDKGADFGITSILFVPGSPDIERYKTDESFVKTIAMNHLLYFRKAVIRIFFYQLYLNSLMYFNRDYYGIKVINYNNTKFKHLDKISNELEQLPIFYTINDLLRYEKINILHKIFSYWYKYGNVLFNLNTFSKFELIRIMYSVMDDIRDIYGEHDEIYKFIHNNAKEYFKIDHH